MDQPSSARPDNGAQITLAGDARPQTPPVPKSKPLPLILSCVGLLAGLAALGISAWTSAQADRENLRLSNELAQLRVSLDLYARNGSRAAPEESAQLQQLAERLSALEQKAEVAAVPLPALAVPAASPQGEDCLPAGMRLLVAMGDSYAICGQEATVEVATIDNGYMTLADGTTIPSGGSMPLPNSACTLAVTSGGDEGLTGYAEIRVSC